METDSFILIGKVQKPHGCKGELIVTWLHSSFIIDRSLRKVWLGDEPSHLHDWDVDYIRPDSDRAILQLKKVNSREQAEYLQGIGVYLPIESDERAATLAVQGFQVIDHQTGKVLGTVEKIDTESPQARYWIQTHQGQFSVPAVPEIIADIDRENRQLKIRNIEGLLPE